MIITGYIKAYDGNTLTIIAPFSDAYFLQDKSVNTCEIRLNDGRSISDDQRRKIYATFRDIANWSGHDPDDIKLLLKYEYIVATGAEWFSLSDCDMTTANLFLNFIIEFCILWDVPCMDSLLDRSPDISRYVYACLIHKKCALCGEKAELHHAEDRVGSGRNRKEIIHLGMRAQPLCRKHHNECHNIGQQTFNEKHLIHGIIINPEICKIWRLENGN